MFSWHLWPELFCFGEVSEHQPRENWTLSYSRIWVHLHLSVDQRWFSRNKVISFIITIVCSLCAYFQTERQIVGEWQREDGEDWKKTLRPCYRQAAVAPVKGHLKKSLFEGRLADSSEKWRVSAGPVTGSRERRNRSHMDGLGALSVGHWRLQWDGMCDAWRICSARQSVASFVLCVFPAFVSLHATFHISQYLFCPTRFTLCVWLLLTSAVSRGKLVLVSLCKSCAPVTGQHGRDWPGRMALSSLSDKAANGWGSCVFSSFHLASATCYLITEHLV